MSSAYVTSWAACSPYGPTTADFAPSAAGRSNSPLGSEVPGFNIREILGRKGTRSLDRVTALTVHTVGELLERAPSPVAPISTGAVIGTTAGSIDSTVAFTFDSVTQERPYLVDPARFPNTVMNCPAGRSAIWHNLRGPNATVAGGVHAMAIALNYAQRLLRLERAGRLVVGCAEELTPTRRQTHEALSHGAVPLIEGAAAFLLEPRPLAGRSHLEIRGRITQRTVTTSSAAAAHHLLGPVLADRSDADALVAPHTVAAIPTSPDQPALIAADIMGGDAGAAAGAFLIAALMKRADHGPSQPSSSYRLFAVDDRQASAITVAFTPAA